MGLTAAIAWRTTADASIRPWASRHKALGKALPVPAERALPWRAPTRAAASACGANRPLAKEKHELHSVALRLRAFA